MKPTLLKLLFLFCLLHLVGCNPKTELSSPTENSQKPADDTDAFFIKLRFETSNDLVDELDGIKVRQVYKVLCNDKKVRDVKVALIDREKRRVGLIVQEGVMPVGGDIGGRAYQPNATAFVKLDWFKSVIQD